MTNFPVSDDDIRALRVKVLRALAAAQYPKEAIGSIATNHQLTVPDVKSLVENYGWPDKSEMARFAIELTGGGDPRPVRPRPAPAVNGDAAAVPRTPVPTPPPVDYRVDTLLAAGEKSSKARTRRLAVRIREQVAELRGLINSESAEREAAEKAAAEKERLRAEVKQLEEQLAAKRAALREGQQARRTAAVSSAAQGPASRNAEIRDWASSQGIELNGRGRIPAAVVAAYDEANGGEPDGG